MNIIFPRWLFPNNLGDSLMFTMVPKILKQLNPSEPIQVETYGDLVNVLKRSPYVDSVIEPTQVSHPLSYKEYALNGNNTTNPVKVIYPEWHPRLWEFWNSEFTFFSGHPTLNLISVNYMLQLGLEAQLFGDYDFSPEVNFDKLSPSKDFFTIGIVPDTKTSNRPLPHPGCDGIGYRFNGPNGLQSWQIVVNELRTIPNVRIVEFSRNFLGLGDIHIAELPMLDMMSEVSKLNLGILSDGGMHHVFTIAKVPRVLLGAQKINKPEFFRVKGDLYDSTIYRDCLDRCNITNLNGWPDLSKTCNLSCEKINPFAISNQVKEYYTKWKSIH
jgi:hypothetical protein